VQSEVLLMDEPGRGAQPGRSHRRHERRHDPAVRYAAARLRLSG
jgi:hypothetical protein